MTQKLATAEWANPDDFAKQNAYAPGKFWLGRSPINGQPLGYGDDRHVCLVSGTRSGKGTTTIIPNLCLWPGSLVVVDPKGENATITAARRGPGSEHCEGMGQSVHVLDPFRTAQVDDELRSRFNPLDTLDPDDPRTIDEAGRIADAIVFIPPDTKDPFWDQSARTMVKGLILHVLTDPMFEGRRNLLTIRQLIARGDHETVAALREAGETKIASAQSLLWEDISKNQSFNGVIAGIGDNMANMAANSPKPFESVLQIANRNTEFLDSPGMQECLASSDFKLSDLKTEPKGVSVYLSLPQRYMGEHFRWLRMMIALIVNEMEATPGTPATGHRVLMCLDEFAGLKRMEVIENAVAQIAGHGVKLFFVLQSLEQLKATYKDNWETFLSNAGLKIFFGLDDHFSREYVSKFIGDTELIRELATATQTTGQTTQHSKGTSSSSSWNNQQSTGTSTGSSTSDSWKSMPFFLRNTAGFFAAIAGKRQATRNRNTGSSTGASESEGGSQSTQDTTSTGTNTGQSTGKNETLHKRPLITTDEVGRYFGRIDDESDPVYPGLGLTILTGANPSPVQRVNYFEEKPFQRLFDAHPDYPIQKAIRSHEKTDTPYYNVQDIADVNRFIQSELVAGEIIREQISIIHTEFRKFLVFLSILTLKGPSAIVPGRWNESTIVATDRRLLVVINLGVRRGLQEYNQIAGKWQWTIREALDIADKDEFMVHSLPYEHIGGVEVKAKEDFSIVVEVHSFWNQERMDRWKPAWLEALANRSSINLGYNPSVSWYIDEVIKWIDTSETTPIRRVELDHLFHSPDILRIGDKSNLRSITEFLTKHLPDKVLVVSDRKKVR